MELLDRIIFGVDLPLEFSKRRSPIGDCLQRQIVKSVAHEAATWRLLWSVLGPGSRNEHVPLADGVEFDNDHIHVEVRGRTRLTTILR
jgi:hypothetical protein